MTEMIPVLGMALVSLVAVGTVGWMFSVTQRQQRLTLAQADESRRHARRAVDRMEQQLFAALKPGEYASFRSHSSESLMDDEGVKLFQEASREDTKARERAARSLALLAKQRENELKRFQNGNPGYASNPLDYDEGVE